jgi:hypothetical protein
VSKAAIRGLAYNRHEVDPPMIQIYSCEANPEGISKPQNAARVSAAQEMSSFVVVVVIVLDAADVNEPFDEPVDELDEDSVRLNTADVSVELVSDLIVHELGLLEIDAFPFGLERNALSPGAVLRYPGEPHTPVISPLSRRIAPEQELPHESMDDEIGIPANRRSEVCIRTSCEAKVSKRIGRIARLSHRPKKDGVHQTFLRPVLDRSDNSLDIGRSWLGWQRR